MRYQAITLALIITAVLSLLPAYAEDREKERYIEDVVGVKNQPVKIKIDSDTGKVVCFWNDETKGWADASLYPTDLDKVYSEKMQLQSMQGELDEMKGETWDDRYRSR